MLQKLVGGGIPADAVAKVGDTYYSDLEEAINASSQEYPAIMLKDVTESNDRLIITKDDAVLNTNGFTLEFVAKPYNYITLNDDIKFTINGSGSKDKPDLIVDQLRINHKSDTNAGSLSLNSVYLKKASSNSYQSLLSISGYSVLKDCVIDFNPKDGVPKDEQLAIFVNGTNIEFHGNNKVIGSIELFNNSTETTYGSLEMVDGSIKKTLTIPRGLIGGRGDALSTVKLPEGWEWVNPAEKLNDSESEWNQIVYAKYKIPNDGYDYSGNGELIDEGKYVKCELYIMLVNSNKWTVEPSIDDWTYGETAKNPVGESLFGDVKYTYKSEKDNIYTTDKPSKPGNYLMRAYVEQNDWHPGYTGLEKIVSFTIHKAIPTYTIPTDLSGVEGESLASIELPSGFSWKDSKQLITKSGVYQAVYTPNDTECYATVDVEINVKMLAKPVGTANQEAESLKVIVDDGGPFTTDNCGSVYDRWGNLLWKAHSCTAQLSDGYSIVNTSDK